MRIAVCFSGHIRAGIEASVNIKRYIGDLFPYCDFFIHTWSISEQKGYMNTNIPGRKYNVDDGIINKIIELYHPKKIGIENFQDVLKKEKNKNITFLGYIPPLMYSFMKSVEYKKEYEQDNGFEYDYVIKLRPDILFLEHRRLSQEFDLYKFENGNEIYIENMKDNWDIDASWCNDVFYLSKSKTMDIASMFYESKKKESELVYPKHGNGSFGFIRHLLMNGIKIYDNEMKNFGYAIYREVCFQYSPLTEVEKCQQCDNYYYSGHSGKLLGYEYDSYYEFLEKSKKS